jgi:hypothetical protein
MITLSAKLRERSTPPPSPRWMSVGEMRYRRILHAAADDQ